MKKIAISLIVFLFLIVNVSYADVFVIYTDNESYAGEVHVTQALKMYRQAMGIDAKLVAVAMYATRYSVADPADPKQMDVVGFDTATPNIISEFIRG